MELVNETDLAVDRALVFDARGAERFVFVAKIAFAIAPKGGLTRMENLAICPVDGFAGEPGVSSLVAESEIGPPKPNTDVVLLGAARTPTGSETSVDVRMQVGPVRRHVRVFGPRNWVGRGSPAPSAPLAFDALPLTWENAFGGEDLTPDDAAAHAWAPANPIGRGLVAAGSKREWRDELLPNVEDPAALLATPGDRPPPAGVGFVARHWEPRRRFAGTYGETWAKERMPLLPEDFDPRFHQAAPALQSAARLVGAELARIEGLTRGAPLAFTVPRPEVRVHVATSDAEQIVDLAIDSLVVDGDRRVVWLLLKGDIDVHGRVDDLVLTRFIGEVQA